MCPLNQVDRAAVMATLRSIDPDDWLLHELDLWLNGPGPDGVQGYGGYAFVLPSSVVVGTCLVDYYRPSEAYLGGVRVASALQNRGYATEMLRRVLGKEASHGGRRFWMISHQDNIPMHKVAEKLGFARVGRWQVWDEAALTVPSLGDLPVREATVNDSSQVGDWLRRHPLDGEESVTSPDNTAWDVVPVTPADVNAWLAKGQVMVAGSGEILGVMACHWGTETSRQLRVRYLRGTPSAVASFLAWLDAERRSHPSITVGIGLPGAQADLVRPYVVGAKEEFPAYAFMRTLEDLLPE